MTKRSETIVLVLWALAMFSFAMGAIAGFMRGDVNVTTSGSALGCFLVLQAILVAVVGRE